eukprot:gene6870-13928_t
MSNDKKPKLTRLQKDKIAGDAFESMLDSELSLDGSGENGSLALDSLSGEELSDDSESSGESSDPLEAFGLASSEKGSEKRERKQNNSKSRSDQRKKAHKQSSVFKYVKKLRERLSKGIKFIDYGPAYTKKDYGGHLGDECAEEFPSYFRIHTLLNNRANPNTPDPTELYFTPMHWCGRYCHLLVMKMLRRAGANINPVNEFGQTPLSLVCMFNQPPSKEEIQQRTVLWLLEQGADVNHIDKGGFSAIDFATANRHTKIVSLLLQHGADILHTNKFFIAKRRGILEYVSDPQTRLLLKTRLETLEARMKAEREQKEAEEKRAADLIRMKQKHEDVAEFRFQKLEQRKKIKDDKVITLMRNMRENKVKEETDQMVPKPSYDTHKYGTWKKENDTSTWSFMTESSLKLRAESVIPASKRLMCKLRDRNKFEIFNERWKEKTGNELEVNWKKRNIFDIAGIDLNENEDEKSMTEKSIVAISDELEIRDENDAELIDENIDDLIDVLRL